MAQRFDDLCRGNNTATLLSSPYDMLAQQKGLRLLAQIAGPYQGNVAAARRSWAARNPDAVVGYARAYISALEWLHDPVNRREACAILEHNVAGMIDSMASASYARMLEQNGGFSRTGRIEDEGIRTVLRLRSHYGSHGRALTSAEKYVDLQYWNRARRGFHGVD
jgi:hypothetical protein